jgi:hypothetical protein
MDAKKVYVIIGKEMTLDEVKSEIKNEGYKFDFHFNKNIEAMIMADEVWVFGNQYEGEEFNSAIGLGKDIWYM